VVWGAVEENSSLRTQSIFEPEVRIAVAEALQASLVDLLALQLVVKQLHWNVIGVHFRPLHLHLDEINAVVVEAIDTVAERLSAIAVSPSGQAGDILQSTVVALVPTGFLVDSVVLELAFERVGEAAKAIRARTETIEDLDTATSDLLHAILIDLEKSLWMLRVQRAG